MSVSVRASVGKGTDGAQKGSDGAQSARANPPRGLACVEAGPT